MTLTYPRSQAVDYTYPFKIDSLTFLSPRLRNKYFYNLFEIFDIYIWVSIFVSIISMTLLLNIINADNKSGNKDSFLWTLTSILLEQPYSPGHLKGFIIKMQLAIWMFAAIIISSSYGGCIFSLITYPHDNNIETIDDLARAIQNNKIRLIQYNGSYLAAYFNVCNLKLLGLLIN